MRRSSILRLLAVIAGASCGGDTPTGPPPPPVPTQLSVVTQPGSSVQNGSALAPQPSVRLRDAQGLPAALAGVSVRVQLTGGGAVLGGTVTVATDVNGVATFSGLTLTGTVGAYTLQFTSGSLTSVDAGPVTLTPGAPTALAVAVAPSATAQAGAALAQQPQVQLKDQSGNDAGGPSVTVTASLVAGTATVTNATAVTSASGLATFAGLALAGATGSYTLRFAAPSLSAVDAPAPTVLAAGPPTQLAMTTQPAAALANGGTLAVQPVVELRDAFGNAAPQAGTTVTAAILTGTGTLGGTTTAVTDAAGRAAFTNLSITGTAGNFTLRFSATGVASAVSGTIAMSAGAATRVRITTPPPIGATNGIALTTQPVVQVQDNSGNLVAGAGVVVTAGVIATGGGALPAITNGTAITDSTGRATFSGLTLTGVAATYLLTVSAPGLGADTAATPTVLQAGSATRLALVQQPGVAANNAQRLAVQPVVRLLDASGNNVAQANVTVTASLVSGPASVTHAAESTSAAGVAVFDSLTITGTVGSYTLRFSAPGVTGVDASAATVLAPGTTTRLTLTTQPSAAGQSGVALATQPVVQLRDVSGNAVPQAAVAVTASVVGGGATVANGAVATAASGAATFAGLAIAGTAGSYTLRFAAAGLTAVDAAAATTIGAGPPASVLIVTEPPATAVSGAPLATAPVVEVRDGAGNPVAGVSVTAGAAGNVVLAPATAVTAANGRATFTGLTLTGTVAGYNLQFCITASCGTLVVGTSFPTALQAGPPATLTVTSAPSASAQSGIVLAAQPVVLVLDQSGNAVGGADVTLSAAGATVSSATVTTDAAGQATWSAVTVSGVPATYTLVFSAGPATATAPLALAPGPPATLTLVTAPSASARSGLVFGQQPVALVRDATANPVPGLLVTASTATATVLNATATTDAAGLATFGTLGLSGPVQSHTLTFATGSASATANVSLAAGPAASIAITQQPGLTAINGAALATQPAVQVLDGTANGVPGAVVTASLTGGGASVSGATAITDASGIATFSALALFGTVGSYTLRFAVNGQAPVTALAATALAAGPASRLVVATPPSTAVNGVAIPTQPVVQIVDAGGNPVAQAGAQVTATLPNGGATLVGATTTSIADGSAAFSGLTLTGTVGNHILRFSAPALTAADASLVLAPGAAAGLAFVTQPASSVPAGVALPQQPVLRLRDVSGNTVPQAGVGVTVASANPTAVFAGATTVTTDGAGLATFAGLAIASPRGRHLLSFSGGAFTPIIAAETTIVAAPLAISVPVSDTAGFDQEHPYVVETMPGDTLLVVRISGGDLGSTADLLVRYGASPDSDHGLWDCRPRLAGSEETCSFRNPAPGLWYVTLLAYPLSFSGVILTVNTYP